jgi:hypothetical protein
MKILILSIFLILSLNIFAQTGPAGVGSSTSNVLWVRSEDLSSLADGDRIATWSDNSGNSNDLTQSDNSYKPEYKTNIQNGYPVVRFNQTNGRIRKTSFTDFPTSDITVFIVNKNNNESNDGIFSYATSSTGGGNHFLIFNSNNLNTYRDNVNRSSGQSTNDNSWHIIDVSWTSDGGGLELWKDNASKYTNTLSDGVDITSGGCLAIAGEQDAVDGNYASNQAHFGDFLEVIVYNIELNSAQRIIVGNYLAAKYALTISNDYYAYQNSYSHDLAGIGRFDATNTHTSAQSADLITIGNASAMTTDGEYLLFAHDDGSISSWSSTGSPYNTQKIARKYRIDETGDVGTIDITLNEDNLAALPSGYTKYGVMIDADGDFTSGAIVYEMAASGSDYKATGVEVTDGDYMCIVAIKPSVQFSTDAGAELESVNASADIELNYVPASNVSIDYSTSNGTASSGSDYTAISATTLSFSAGTRVQTVTVTVTDDATGEGNEDFTINLSNPSSGLNIGTNGTYTHTINDNDNTRKIYFSAASSSGSESTTSVNIAVEISSSDGSNSTTVDYSVTGGTASGGGTDFTLADGTATISSGNTTTNISVSINNDALDEDNETIVITLSSPSSNCNLSSSNPTEHTYTINDDDDPPTVYFTNTSSSGAESVATKDIEVKLSAVSSKDVSVSFSASGTASSGSDYSISTLSPITITAGTTTTDISVTIFDDNTQETDETLILTLSGPTNASLGANTQHTYTITNDDFVGYEGPGGVGKSTNLKIWVKAEDIPGSSNGDKISSWADKSGNSNNLAQSDATYQPLFYDNIVNGFQIARFSADNARLVKTSFADFPTSEITSYYVGYTTTSNSDASISYATSGSNNEYLLFGSNNVQVFRANERKSTGIDARNAWSIVGASWRNSDDNVLAYLNGQQKYDNTLPSDNDITQNGCLAIGGEQDAVNGGYDANQDYEGDIAEVFIYNVILNSAQINIVNNYLSAKYNIAMAANDKYAGDDSGKDNYDFEVIGIGTESDGIHDEAHGSGGLWIEQASNFGNGDYLLIGHNHITPQIYTPDDDAGMTAVSIEKRWARDWYFDITDAGSAITVDLTFDFTEAEMNSSSSPAGTTTNYKLLYRSGTSGDWKIVSSASSKTASQVLFTGQALADGDGYYTLGTIDSTNSPLPIELISFDAINNNSSVILNWETATEINNDFFEIQHSINNNDWEEIGRIEGNGTTNKLHSYSFTHQSPVKGVNYYRLKQTDFDGKFSFSQIRSVNIGPDKNIEIYPNPSNGLIHITNIQNDSKIELIDLNSRLINIDIQYNDGEAVINIKDLPKSIYFIRIISNNKVETYRIIRN